MEFYFRRTLQMIDCNIIWCSKEVFIFNPLRTTKILVFVENDFSYMIEQNYWWQLETWFWWSIINPPYNREPLFHCCSGHGLGLPRVGKQRSWSSTSLISASNFLCCSSVGFLMFGFGDTVAEFTGCEVTEMFWDGCAAVLFCSGCFSSEQEMSKVRKSRIIIFCMMIDPSCEVTLGVIRYRAFHWLPMI